MVLDYFTKSKSKQAKTTAKPTVSKPVLSDEDELFLNRITSEQAPPLPERPIVILESGKKVEGKDAQVALMDGADSVPLPQSPPNEGGAPNSGSKDGLYEKKVKNYWTYVSSRLQRGKVCAQ